MARQKIKELDECQCQSESESRFYRLMRLAPTPFCHVDGNGNIIFVNIRFEQMFGYTIADIPTLDVWFQKAYPNSDYRRWVVETWDAFVNDAEKTGSDIRSSEYRVTCKDGTDKLVEISGVTFGTEILATFHDRTPQRQAEMERADLEAKFSTVFHSSTVGKSLTGADGTLLEINEAFANMLGYTVSEMLKINFANITHPEDIAESQKLIKDLLDGIAETREIEKRYIHKNGSIVWTSVSTRLLRNAENKPVYFVTSINNITPLKDAMAQLERSNRDLEQFAYMASHDLQEPLRMVSSYTQLLAKRYVGKLDEDADEFIHYAVNGANRMQQLIKDLLQFSRVTTKGKSLEPVDTHSALAEAIGNLEMMISDKKAIISAAQLPVVMADKGQLVRVFQNLICNAIKFSGESKPNVTVSAQRNKCDWQFCVTDNGIGIDKKYFDKIFEIFQHLNSSSHYEGTGIGLAISKRIIERHGGRIWVESSPGNGSSFYFTLKGENDA
ncbi:MAG: PAS domain S-box protein [Deltaproteobacteria bacterium]|nr:PAS domain S-box protein [Deltaproteobacteria bacterium]